MVEAIYAILVGLKLAIYLSVLVMAFLVDIAEKGNKRIHGLNIMAVFLMFVAIFEFANVLASSYEGLFSVLSDHENIHLFTKPALLIAGLGLIWYLNGIRKNIKNYF